MTFYMQKTSYGQPPVLKCHFPMSQGWLLIGGSTVHVYAYVVLYSPGNSINCVILSSLFPRYPLSICSLISANLLLLTFYNSILLVLFFLCIILVFV